MFKHFTLTAAILATLTITSCGTDEPETPDAPSDNTEQPGVNTPGTGGDTPGTGGDGPGTDEPRENPITINADGSNSAGVPFRRIDDTTFGINYTRYQIFNDSTIIVLGIDNGTELKRTLKGKVNLYSTITIDGLTYKVSAIKGEAFSGCTSLTSITIPESITDIGREAFSKCTSLTSITLPKSIETIRERAFSGCKQLRYAVINDNNYSLRIPEYVNTNKSDNDDYIFADCNNLQVIHIPGVLTVVGEFDRWNMRPPLRLRATHLYYHFTSSIDYDIFLRSRPDDDDYKTPAPYHATLWDYYTNNMYGYLHYPIGCAGIYSNTFESWYHLEFDPATFNFLDLLDE